MKISTKLKVLAAVMLMFSSTYGMEEDRNHSDSPLTQPIAEQNNIDITREVNNVVTINNVIPSNRDRDYRPFLRSIGITQNIEKVIESCKFLEKNYLTDEQLAQADMEALTLNQKRKESVYDLITSGWGFAQWCAGTSQNFASVTVVLCAVFANVFPEDAVALATSSGAVAGIGALLSKIYSYCQQKRLSRIAYNMVVMAGQAAAQERKDQLVLEDQIDDDPTHQDETDV